MRYIFFGTPQIAAVILDKLIQAGMPPLALVCNPDRPFGRKQILTPPPTKALIAERGAQSVEILQPEKLDSRFASRLSRFRPDFFVVAAYGKIIPKEILELPRLGAIGVHFSLLPKYRGPSPVQTAILNGEKETGVSVYLLDEKVDAGPVLLSQKLNIDEKNFTRLSQELADLSAEMLIKLIPEFLESKIKAIPQNHTLATYTRKFTSTDAFINPQDLEAATGGDEKKAEAILRKIRALNPEPGVWTLRDGKRIKLLAAEIQNDRLILKKIQIAGQKAQAC
jgi:methionyl-tRNA formyltransferase